MVYDHWSKKVVNNWLQKLSQKYPGGEYIGVRDSIWGKEKGGTPIYDFNVLDKFRYWGLTPSGDLNSYRELASNINLTRIPAKDISEIIKHLVEKYYSQLEKYMDELADGLCEDRPSFRPLHNLESLDESNNLLDVLFNDVESFISNLSARTEVVDQEFIRQLSVLTYDEVAFGIDKTWRRHGSEKQFFVRVYGSSKAFGGYEEGGWWYNNNTMVHEENITGLVNVCKRKGELEKEYAARAKDSFYEDLENTHGGAEDLYDEHSSEGGVGSSLNYGQRDVDGMSFPLGWTTSAFEKFFVKVELTRYPKEETKERPLYE